MSKRKKGHLFLERGEAPATLDITALIFGASFVGALAVVYWVLS